MLLLILILIIIVISWVSIFQNPNTEKIQWQNVRQETLWLYHAFPNKWDELVFSEALINITSKLLNINILNSYTCLDWAFTTVIFSSIDQFSTLQKCSWSFQPIPTWSRLSQPSPFLVSQANEPHPQSADRTEPSQ